MSNKEALLNEGDRIVTAYAEHADGPGWSNRPLYIIVRNQSGELREECLQPEEQGAEVAAFYDIAAVVNKEVVGAVRRKLWKQIKKAKKIDPARCSICERLLPQDGICDCEDTH